MNELHMRVVVQSKLETTGDLYCLKEGEEKEILGRDSGDMEGKVEDVWIRSSQVVDERPVN